MNSISDNSIDNNDTAESRLLDDITMSHITDRHPLVKISQLEILYDSVLISQLYIIGGALFSAFIYLGHAKHSYIATWFITITIIAAGGILLAYKFKHAEFGKNDIKKWIVYFNIGCITMGMAWFAAAIIVVPADSLIMLGYTGIVMCGVGAGAVTVLSVYPMVFYSFILSSLIPTGLWLIVFRSSEQLTLGMLLLIFSGFMLIIAKRLNNTFIRNTLLKLENARLIQSLRLEAYNESNTRHQLQESEKRYRDIFDNASDMVFLADLNGRFLLVNRLASKITGYSQDELMGMSYLDLAHPDYRQACKIFYQEQFEKRTAESYYRYLIKTRDGKNCWLAQNARLIFENGEPKNIEVIARDVTAKVMTEEALIYSEINLRAVLENIADAVITLDNSAHIESFNAAAERVFGYHSYEVIGKPVSLLIPEAYENANTEQIKQYTETGESEFVSKNREVIALHKDGNEFPAIISLSAMNISNEIKFTGIARDISEEKRAYQAILDAKEQAEASKKAEEKFIATISHEIRTPMNAVIGFIDLLSETNLNDTQKEYKDGLAFSSQRLLRIVNDLLEYKRIEARKIEFVDQDFSLQELLEGQMKIFSNQANLKGIKLGFTIDNAIPSSINGDEARLAQILQNLISNAIKYTEKGHVKVEIELNAKDEDDVELKFNVIDTGVGVPEKKIKYVFDAYKQMNAERDSTIGSGLGLSIVRTLVELQGGKAFVNSIEGHGSTFGFTLSFKASDKTVVEEKTVDYIEAINNLAQKSLLIVDDEEMNVYITIKFLERFSNLKLHSAENGKQALKIISEHKIDMILTDINMPIMNGYELTLNVRNSFASPQSDVPIIALTAEHAPQEKLSKNKIDDFLLKPFTKEALYEKIHEVLTA